MARPSRRAVAAALLERHGRTYAEELRIDVAKGTPSPLFRLLCASVLFSARINSEIAAQAADGLRRAGWTTAEKLAGSTWKQRVDVLNDAGYTRYQERTATMLGDMADHLLEEYRGDLRRLRDDAGHDPAQERRLLKRCKGLGDVGVDIFFREAQAAWEELRPFADRRALRASGRLGLGDDARALSRAAPDGDVTRLVAALVRADLAGDFDEIRRAAR
jgi:hypothetical protein